MTIRSTPLEKKFYRSKIDVIKVLAAKVEGLDTRGSAYVRGFGFATLDGSKHQCTTVNQFATSVNDVFGEVLSVPHCKASGLFGGAIITFLDNPSPKVLSDEGTSETLSDALSESIEATETSDAPVSEDFAESILEAAAPSEKPDLGYATSLQEGKSKTEAKEALEEYGRTFGIELSRSKTFANMLIDLMA